MGKECDIQLEGIGTLFDVPFGGLLKRFLSSCRKRELLTGWFGLIYSEYLGYPGRCACIKPSIRAPRNLHPALVLVNGLMGGAALNGLYARGHGIEPQCVCET